MIEHELPVAGHEAAVGEADGLVGVEAGKLQLALLGEVGGVGGVAVLHPAPVLGLEPCTHQSSAPPHPISLYMLNPLI